MTPLTVAVEATAAVPGGGLSYLAQQLPALASEGASLVVFAGPDAAEAVAPLLPGATVIAVRSRSLVGRLAYVHGRLASEARRRGAEVLYCPGSAAPLTGGGLPVVVCIQNPHLFVSDRPRSIRHSLLRVAAWVSALRASAVVHLTESMADEFRRTSALDAPVRVILSGAGSLGAEGPRSPAATVPAGRPYLLAVSNFYAYKRMDLVLRAYACEPCLRDRYDLVIAGAEIQPGAIGGLRHQARSFGLKEDRVRLPGFVAGDDLARLYEGASLYVSASEREAFPLTPAEALVAGLPVVLTDIAPFRELYGEWATFAPVGRPDALAAAMLAALQAGPRPRQSAAVRERFTWERNGRDLAALLAWAAASPRPRVRDALRRVRPRELGTFLRTVIGRRGPVAGS